MPFYEYECSACKFYVETLQKVSEPPLKKCPSCGKATMQRLISAPVFRLKGAGWYETDFKSDQENKRNLADGAEPATAADSDSEKKTKVRASKVVAKVVAKKVAGKQVKPDRKAARKSAGKTAVKSLSKKLPGKKKPAAKVARKRAKKKISVIKKPARKK